GIILGSVFVPFVGDLLDINSGILKTFGTGPLVNLISSSLIVGIGIGVFGALSVTDAILALGGPLLVANNSSIVSQSAFVRVGSGTVVSTTLQPLVQLTNTPLSVSVGFSGPGDFLSLNGCGSSPTPCGAQMILSGPLLQSTGSDVGTSGRLIFFNEGTL